MWLFKQSFIYTSYLIRLYYLNYRSCKNINIYISFCFLIRGIIKQALEVKLQELTEKYEKAVEEKNICQAQEEKTRETIDLANRLVNGLASENIRWRETVHK